MKKRKVNIDDFKLSQNELYLYNFVKNSKKSYSSSELIIAVTDDQGNGAKLFGRAVLKLIDLGLFTVGIDWDITASKFLPTYYGGEG